MNFKPFSHSGFRLMVLTVGILLTVSSVVVASDSITVLSFNIRYDNPGDGDNRWKLRKDAVAQQIRDVDPDILCLQEALRHQLDELHELVPGYEEFGVGRDDGAEAGEYCAILLRHDRFQVHQHATFWLAENYAVPGERSFGNNIPRIVTFATLIDHNGDTLTVFNTHLDHESQESREQSVRLIRYLMWQNGVGALVLAGDFNAGEDNPAMAPLTEVYQAPTVIRDGRGDVMTVEWEDADSGKGETWREPFRDSFRVIHPDADSVGTFNGWTGERSGDKIDYVFVSKGVAVLDVGMLHEMVNGRYTSDHFPVYARVQLRQ